MAKNAASRTSLVLWAALFGIGLGWGSTQLFSKLIMQGGHHPLGVSLTGTVLGAICATAMLVATGRSLPITRRHLVFFALVGFMGTALPHTLGYAAVRELPVGVMSILISMVPISTFCASLVLGMERPDGLRLLGLCAGAGAVLLIVLPETSLPDPEKAVWVALPIIVSLSYTAESLYVARARPDGCDALQTMCGLFWAACLLQLPVVIASDTWMTLGAFDISELSLLATTLCHVGAYTGFVWLIGRAGPVFAAQVGYVVTLVGVVLGIAFLGETHSPWIWLAMVVMMIGLALVQPREPE
ncbi:MAG: DMT family transporter [Pseudomonadota bacterium]